MKRLSLLLTVLIIMALMVSACAQQATPAPEEAAEVEAPAEEEAPPEEAPAAEHPALADGKITIAWIPKALNNPVFELGRDGALVKADELTAQGPYEVEIQ